ncbi:hypothetical protein FHJ31_23720 [Pseudomonas sp. Fig-3]|nr:hypothetical protein FHJ31_23720 [Pseudomonas sp. Fig-3]
MGASVLAMAIRQSTSPLTVLTPSRARSLPHGLAIGYQLPASARRSRGDEVFPTDSDCSSCMQRSRKRYM